MSKPLAMALILKSFSCVAAHIYHCLHQPRCSSGSVTQVDHSVLQLGLRTQQTGSPSRSRSGSSGQLWWGQ